MPGLKQLIRKVLEQGYLMSLGTLDKNGVWVADVIYIHDDDFNLYWMSDPETRHSIAIASNPKAAGTITISKKKESNLGIQFEGVAEKIEGSRLDLATKHLIKRGRLPSPEQLASALQGDSWYKLKPTKIDLIHEEHFGYDKQTFNL